eukprot:2586760-Pyramimonas_sp.AAC.1
MCIRDSCGSAPRQGGGGGRGQAPQARRVKRTIGGRIRGRAKIREKDGEEGGARGEEPEDGKIRETKMMASDGEDGGWRSQKMMASDRETKMMASDGEDGGARRRELRKVGKDRVDAMEEQEKDR